jgi:hypothetical protein
MDVFCTTDSIVARVFNGAGVGIGACTQDLCNTQKKYIKANLK